MIFTTTLTQMLVLFFLISVGYLLAKLKLVPQNAEAVLSKLENYIFMPALVMGTFMTNFTVDLLDEARDLLFVSIAIEIVVIAVSLVMSKICSKDRYVRNIFLYGLCFSNFGFLGNAVVSSIFPEMFTSYTIFTLVLWATIYAWGVPVLLMSGNDENSRSLKATLIRFANPMFIGMAIGMVIGLVQIPIPLPITNLIDSLGACMSPIAMLLTGMTIARQKITDVLKFKNVYVLSAIRLLMYPAIFIAFVYFVPMNEVFATCALCSLAMPLGLNTIVIPASYGKDTKVASGMAIISHVMSLITIPVIFALFNWVISRQ